MEEVHGVDVSWLYKPNKVAQARQYRLDVPDPSKKPSQEPDQPKQTPQLSNSAPASSQTPSSKPTATATTNGNSLARQTSQTFNSSSRSQDAAKYPPPTKPAPPKISGLGKDAGSSLSAPVGTPSALPPTDARTPPPGQPLKRPGLLGRTGSERSGKDSRRPSWMTNLSSKLSSSTQTSTQSQPYAGLNTAAAKGSLPAVPSSTPTTNGVHGSPVTTNKREEVEVTTPTKQKDPSSSFFSNLTRRLSVASQGSGGPKTHTTGATCPRKVLNVDPNRPRVRLPDLDHRKLRRVSFCVDVEIASGPKYKDDLSDGVAADAYEDEDERQKRRQDMKLKDKAEGAAMKNPELLQHIKEEKDNDSSRPSTADSNIDPLTPGSFESAAADALDNEKRGVSEDGAADPQDPEEAARLAKKKEKKQRSEAERKQRRDNRRRRAEEQGLSPLELRTNSDETIRQTQPDAVPAPELELAGPGAIVGKEHADQVAPQVPKPAPGSRQDRPTTDPVRIYRRCCQLRETPILKRITEQLMNPNRMVPGQPGVVNCLDLTGSRLQLADMVTLGDWLAVVPVKRLIMEDADLSDEGMRVVLAGLLAAKRPEPTKRKTTRPLHRESSIFVAQGGGREERSGVVEKLTFKNNPRLTRVAWKYVSAFLYMCKSIKALDMSSNRFPSTLPPSAALTPVKVPPQQQGGSTAVTETRDLDTAELLYKCLIGRQGGDRLEELSFSECELNADQVRKIVDGAIICGVSRLGLGGNNLDDDAITHVIHYIRSGVCQGLDLGGNDLRAGKLDMIISALVSSDNLSTIPTWGLSLSHCNLDPRSMRNLFSMLVKMPNVRFVDLSHNRDLCADGTENRLVLTLRRYISQMKALKRLHVADVGMSPSQAIALAEVLPEGPVLAHINMLDNPELSHLASATDEASQEEACAVFASLCAAARVSRSIVCIDIDVPTADTNEVVRALAKQVVAYCLRNMETFALKEAAEAATAHLAGPHGGQAKVKAAPMSDELYQVIGKLEATAGEGGDGQSPEEDYIVGGTGVVRALQYVLGQNDRKSSSTTPSSPFHGSLTPSHRPGSSAGLDPAETKKAKLMSKDLLDVARKIKARVEPDLVKASTAGDELAYRRILFLDHTLHNIISRFEEEYPECSLNPELPVPTIQEHINPITMQRGPNKRSKPQRPAVEGQISPYLGDRSDSSDDEPGFATPTSRSRRNSDVSMVSRRMGDEEGRLHRLGQHLRRSVIDSPSSKDFRLENGDSEGGGETVNGNTVDFSSPLWTAPADAEDAAACDARERERLRELGERIQNFTGDEMRRMVGEKGWEQILEKVGANYEDLRYLQEQDPQGWESFVESHMKARANVENPRPGSAMGEKKRQGIVFEGF